MLDGVHAIAARGTKPHQSAPPRESHRRHRLILLTAALAVVPILTTVGLYWTAARTPAVEPAIIAGADRIAVLDFATAAETSLEVFARGLADRIVGVMSVHAQYLDATYEKVSVQQATGTGAPIPSMRMVGGDRESCSDPGYAGTMARRKGCLS